MQITLNIPDNLPADIVAQYISNIKAIEQQIALLAKNAQQSKTDSSTPENNLTEGEKVLQLLEKYELLGCMQGDGLLSETYKQHLWK
jgi:hypothetical protein